MGDDYSLLVDMYRCSSVLLQGSPIEDETRSGMMYTRNVTVGHLSTNVQPAVGACVSSAINSDDVACRRIRASRAIASEIRELRKACVKKYPDRAPVTVT